MQGKEDYIFIQLAGSILDAGPHTHTCGMSKGEEYMNFS